MGQLIEDLLNLSRVSRVGLVRQPVNCSEMAAEVINDLKQQNPGHNVDVEIWSDITVNADAKLLRIVFENLLGNAWKFSSRQSSPHIEVGTMRDGKREIYFVRDNGAGFDMKYADKLFGPFQRLHAMNEYPGTGIGLATVQRVIHRHGGRIWFDSKAGQGAVFYFTLDGDFNAAEPS
jgi:light-regulated signal transduction histidine kinase (bacteriophytochrome)